MLSELGERINKYRENFNKELEKNIYIYIKIKSELKNTKTEMKNTIKHLKQTR